MGVPELKNIMTENSYSVDELPVDQIQENKSVGQQKITRLKYKEKRRIEITENRETQRNWKWHNVCIKEKEGEGTKAVVEETLVKHFPMLKKNINGRVLQSSTTPQHYKCPRQNIQAHCSKTDEK